MTSRYRLSNRNLPIAVAAISAGLTASALFAIVPAANGQTGTFIDRNLATDLRVMSYNIYQDSIFPATNATQAAKFARVVQAVRPDVMALQEIYDHHATEVVMLMISRLPLSVSGNWYAY